MLPIFAESAAPMAASAGEGGELKPPNEAAAARDACRSSRLVGAGTRADGTSGDGFVSAPSSDACMHSTGTRYSGVQRNAEHARSPGVQRNAEA